MPPSPAKNGSFSVSGYGSIDVLVTRITHGVKFIADTTGARGHRTVMPKRLTSGSCEVTILHTKRSEYQEVNEWLKVYAETIANPDGNMGVMRVRCPVVRFDRLCIPSTGIRFGAAWSEFTWEQTIGFAGASDPIDLTSDLNDVLSTAWSPGFSQFSQAVVGGGDLVGNTTEDALYNSMKSLSM